MQHPKWRCHTFTECKQPCLLMQSCVHETCVRRLHAAWGVTVYRIILPLRGGVGLEFDLVLLGLHWFLRLAHALYCHSGDAWLVLLSPCNTRLTACMMQSLRKFLKVDLRLSSGYHPQTDGQTQNFHRISLTSLRSYVIEYHSDWVQRIPAFLFAQHCALCYWLYATQIVVWLVSTRFARSAFN